MTSLAGEEREWESIVVARCSILCDLRGDAYAGDGVGAHLGVEPLCPLRE